MIRYLGWLNVFLIALSLSPFLLRRIRKHIIKKPSKKLSKALKFLSKIHPYLGVVLLITSFLHGYLALGTIRLHTGYLTWFLIVVLFALRMWGIKSRNRYWLILHRAVAGLVVVALLIHIFARNLI